MLQELQGNIKRFTTEAFQKYILPKPPNSVMLTDEQIKTLSQEFATMLGGYVQRASEKNAKQEIQLVTEFADIVNNHIFSIVKGKSVVADTAVSRAEYPYPLTLLDCVPGYVMRVKGDSRQNAPDAGLFRDDVALEEASPNWAHQRAFWAFNHNRSDHNFHPFDETPDTESSTGHEAASDTPDRNAACAETMFAFQHCSAVYSFSVQESELCLMRWDKSGVFFTENVNYVEQTRTFVELILGFIILDDASQGIDTSTTLLDKTSEEYQFMDRLAAKDPACLKMTVLPFAEDTIVSPEILPMTVGKASTPLQVSMAEDTPYPSSADKGEEPSIVTPKDGGFVFEYVLDAFKTSLEKEFPRYRIPIGNDTFLVARPIFQSTGVIGRSTRCYVAWHEQSKSFMFLKDTWRSDYESARRTEGDILDSLNSAGVRNIPTVVCHTSVVGQRTLGSHCRVNVDSRTDYEQEKAASPSPASEGSITNKDSKTNKKRKRDDSTPEDRPKENVVHYYYTRRRLATQEVCLPLRTFRTSKQLVQVVGDCIEAHADAYEKCKLIHHDISSGNLLILPVLARTPGEADLRVVWTGILSDWEISKPVAESGDAGRARKSQRTGTLKYMASALLEDKYHIVGIPDEIESFFLVLFYNALRYLPHNLHGSVSYLIAFYFDVDMLQNGELVGGMGRGTLCRHAQFGDSDRLLVFGGKSSMPLNIILQHMHLCLLSRHKIADYEHRMKLTDDDSAPPRQRLRIEEGKGGGDEQKEEKGTEVEREHDSKGDDDDNGNTLVYDKMTFPEPTERDLMRCEYLQTHEFVRRLFRDQRSKTTWPKDEKWEDHVAARQRRLLTRLTISSTETTSSVSECRSP
ncbi:hypothetical protein C8Q74DRAFT_1232805 [Fomes fomentarius]|nr:hypothetical protein C8Q74DRAFT_1232805 [Fomes fomentarius]